MSRNQQYLNPADAARRLGVSAKALRVYEERGLVKPLRTEAGWRTYGPEEQARVKEIVGLRSLGLSLRQIADVLAGDYACLDRLLEAHHRKLDQDLGTLAGQVRAVADLRARLARGEEPPLSDLANLAQVSRPPAKVLELPWPWGGETYELPALAPITFLTGSLGSGKTRLAQTIAESFEGGMFLGLDREAAFHDAEHDQRVVTAIDWIEGEGGQDSHELRALLAATEGGAASVLVFDLVEHGLDEATQIALMTFLRTGASAERPLLLMTRSTAILDLNSAHPADPIIYCPANHSPPLIVAPWPGTPGYEAVATCLAPPHVRARTEGVVVMRTAAGE